jgi:hypothetical protein
MDEIKWNLGIMIIRIGYIIRKIGYKLIRYGYNNLRGEIPRKTWKGNHV